MKKYFLFFSICSVLSSYGATVKVTNASTEPIFVRINNNNRFWAPLEREQREVTSLPFVPDILGPLDNHIADFRPIPPGKTVNFRKGLRSIKNISFMRVSPNLVAYVLSPEEAKIKVETMLRQYALVPTLQSGEVPGKDGKVPGMPFHSEYLELGKFYQQKLREKIDMYPKKDGKVVLYYPETVETFNFNPDIGALKFGAHIEYAGWKKVKRIQ